MYASMYILQVQSRSEILILKKMTTDKNLFVDET